MEELDTSNATEQSKENSEAEGKGECMSHEDPINLTVENS